jgi:hypothetical protein
MALVPGIFLGVKGGQRVRLTTSPPSVSRLSSNVGASRSHNHMGPSRPVTGIALPFTLHTEACYFHSLTNQLNASSVLVDLWDEITFC